MKKSSFCLAVFFALLLANPASATPNFPGAIQADLGLSAPPPCADCHTTGDVGGLGTVNTPFGTTMRSRGLVAYDEASLKNALLALQAEGKDSDGDGVPDITELQAGTDPNNAPGTESSVPAYGCGAQVSPGRALPDASVLLLAAGVIIWLRRRARSTMHVA